MKIIFTITAHTFENAALIESALKRDGINYTVTADNKKTRRSMPKPQQPVESDPIPCHPPTSKRKRAGRGIKLTPQDVKEIAEIYERNKHRPLHVIAKMAGVGMTVVARIRDGQHKFQQETS